MRSMQSGASRDVAWDLVVEIAAKLLVDGEYVTELDALPTQRLVDHQWAAHQAGRVLGVRARVRLSGPLDCPPGRNPGDGRRVTMRVTHVDPTGDRMQRAQAGLESLLALVLEQHDVG